MASSDRELTQSDEQADGDQVEQRSGYDLLSEEDPEEFVNVEIPSDLRVSDDSVVPQSKGRPRSKLLSALKKPPQRRKKPMEPIQDISQVCMCVCGWMN